MDHDRTASWDTSSTWEGGKNSKRSNGSQEKMAKILHFLPGDDAEITQAMLDKEAISKIVNNSKCEKLPFLVVSINGKKRTGKSFTANLIIRFLQHLEEDTNGFSNWLETNPEISGVEWRQGRPSVTTGIWMWNRPFVIKQARGKEVGVLLMDCQGLFEQSCNSDTIDAVITLCGLEMSKVHLLNIQGDMNAADLRHFENCITYAGVGGMKSLFNTLILLHRDWTADDEALGIRQNYFEYLRTQRALNVTEEKVAGAFLECMEFMLPLPGSKIQRGNEEQRMHLQDLLEEEESMGFFKCLQQLFNLLFLVFASDDKYLTSQEDLLHSIQRLNERLADGENNHKFASVAELMEKGRVLDVYEQLEAEVLRKFDEDIDPQRYGSERELNDIIERYAEQAGTALIRKKEEVCTTTKAAENAWRMVDEKVMNWFVRMRTRKLEALSKKLKTRKVFKIVASTVGVGVLGALTGGIGLAFAGPLIAVEAGVGAVAAAAAAGGAIGAGVGGAGSTAGIAIEEAIKRGQASTGRH